MRLNLNTGDKLKTEGKWVEYDSDVSFKIRYASPKLIQRLRKDNLKKRWKRGVQVEDVNEEKWDEDLWDHLIEKWKGIVIGDNNKEAECNRINKKILSDLSGEHANFILDFASDISNYIDQEQEDREIKNSKTSSTLE